MSGILYWHELCKNPVDDTDDENYIDDSIPVFDRGAFGESNEFSDDAFSDDGCPPEVLHAIFSDDEYLGDVDMDFIAV